MADFILTDKQFKTIEEDLSRQSNYTLALENWEKFSIEERKWIIETLKGLNPEKVKLIKEAWYNTLGDVIGLFDPTGVVDLVNGISYISQGENLFGLLSMISAVPYIGDVVAKPVMGALKLGKPSAKALENVLKLSKAGKSKDAATELARISSYGGITTTFVNGFGKVAGKLRGYIERAPSSIFGGLKRTILQWFDLFENAAKSGTMVRKAGQELATKIKGIPAGSNAIVRISKADQIKQLNKLIELSKSTPGIFTGYRTSKGLLSGKTLFRGMPQLIGRNASVRALARQTKWWLGFLDYIGIGNFVGPEELLKKMGEGQLTKKMNEYQNTSEAEKYFEEDFGSEQSQSQPTSTSAGTTTQSSSSEQKDPFANMLNKLFMGAINPLP